MLIDRRQGLKAILATTATTALGSRALAAATDQRRPAPAIGNPILPFRGVCDPQVRVYDDQVYLYATHDASAASKTFLMNDWWVWKSSDLVAWEEVSVLTPEQTYWAKPSRECWATDAARRDDKYFFYFSRGPEEIGVVQSDHPDGPWRDPLGKPLVAKGSTPTQARDPGILQEPDGTSYIVFGTWDYYIARLSRDMISLAEPPRRIEIAHPEGPYGPGKTDDKPFLHRRGDKYYLSWGCFYAMGDSPYGPFEYKGSLITRDLVDPEFRDVPPPKGLPPRFQPHDMLLADRHGSFFELHGQWYFICNDQSLPGSGPYFRNSVISYVRYRRNGEMAPVRLTRTGVGQYDAARGIEAADFFRVHAGRVEEQADGIFVAGSLRDGSWLLYPKVRNLAGRSRLTVHAAGGRPRADEIEVRRGGPRGHLLGRLRPLPEGSDAYGGDLRLTGDRDDLCLVVRSRPVASFGLKALTFG